MGCDIHIYAERITENGKWELDIEETISFAQYGGMSRHYEVFAMIAGVRNRENISVIIPTKGLPDDASDYVKERYDEFGYDAHHASWLYPSELKKIGFDGNYKGISLAWYFFSVSKDNKRLVFWFDN